VNVQQDMSTGTPVTLENMVTVSAGELILQH
jgi:hypothetical protein